MSVLVVQEFPEGTPPDDIDWTYNPGTTNSFPNDGRTQLLVRNDEATPLVCTATAKRACSHGFLHDRPDTVSADSTAHLQVCDRYRFNNSEGHVEFVLSRSSTSIAVAAVRVIPR